MTTRISLASMRPSPGLISTWAAILALLAVAVTPALARDGRRGAIGDRAATITESVDVGTSSEQVEASIVPAGPVDVALNVAVDDVDVDAAARQLLVTAVLSNMGGEADLALCPAMFLGGTVRPIQGYAFVPGEASAVCTAAVDHAPTLGMSIDSMPAGAPACPAAAPVTATGDRAIVPAAAEGLPGILVLQYAYLLADLGDGVELETPAQILDRIRAGDGIVLNMLTAIDPAQTALTCPAGVDTFLAGAPAPEFATLETQWLHAPAAAGGEVIGSSTLHSPASIGAEADTNAYVMVEWSDNLDVPLADILVHDPEPGIEFPLAPGDLMLGTLTATFPADLPEGFRGEAVVKVYAVGTETDADTLLSISRHPFVIDTAGPAILAGSTVRSDDDVAIMVAASDETSGIGGVRLIESRAGVDAPSRLMDYLEGDFEAETTYTDVIDTVAAADVIGARVMADDGSGNLSAATLPVAGAGEDATLECNTDLGADFTLDGSGSTYAPADEAATMFTWTSDAFDPPLEGMTADVFLPLGETVVMLTLEDDRAFTGTDMVSYLVEDTTPPVIESVEVTRECLWPPNHKYVRYELGEHLIVVGEDICDPTLDIKIIDVSSNQPDNGNGDGNTDNDAVFGETAFCVRSERAGGIRGDRVYTVTVEVTDDAGLSATGTTYVRVPHDQREHDCPGLENWELASGDWCDLERVGQSAETRERLNRGRAIREGLITPGNRPDRPGRNRR